MRIILTLLLAINSVEGFGQAAQKGSVQVILPEDVVQESIKLIAFSTPTNTFGVVWTYTAAGATKTCAAWEADGSHYGLTPEFKKSWLKHPSDHEFHLTRAAAEELVAGLKTKKGLEFWLN